MQFVFVKVLRRYLSYNIVTDKKKHIYKSAAVPFERHILYKDGDKESLI